MARLKRPTGVTDPQWRGYRDYVAAHGRRVAKLQAAALRHAIERPQKNLIDGVIAFHLWPRIVGPEDYCPRCGDLVFSGSWGGFALKLAPDPNRCALIQNAQVPPGVEPRDAEPRLVERSGQEAERQQALRIVGELLPRLGLLESQRCQPLLVAVVDPADARVGQEPEPGPDGSNGCDGLDHFAGRGCGNLDLDTRGLHLRRDLVGLTFLRAGRPGPLGERVALSVLHGILRARAEWDPRGEILGHRPGSPGDSGRPALLWKHHSACRARLGSPGRPAAGFRPRWLNSVTHRLLGDKTTAASCVPFTAPTAERFTWFRSYSRLTGTTADFVGSGTWQKAVRCSPFLGEKTGDMIPRLAGSLVRPSALLLAVLLGFLRDWRLAFSSESRDVAQPGDSSDAGSGSSHLHGGNADHILAVGCRYA